MKRNVPLMIAMLGGLIMMIQYFIPHQASQDVFDYYTEWAPLVGSFALILGVGSITRVHVHKIRAKAPNWPFSLCGSHPPVPDAALRLLPAGVDRWRH